MTLNEYTKQEKGRAASLARALGITPVLISQWTAGVRGIPPERVVPIAIATDGMVTPYEMRPDLYPDPSWLPPGVSKAS